jgi:hypothetical protein
VQASLLGACVAFDSSTIARRLNSSADRQQRPWAQHLEDPDELYSINISSFGEQGGAVIVVDSAVGWYRTLVAEGNALPGDPNAWSVDLVIAPVGWIGTFNRSPETGLWYSGAHDLHLKGN